MATARKTKSPKPNPLHVIVCMTASSTMYYGEIDALPTSAGPITIRNARHIYSWGYNESEGNNLGIGNLAIVGPGTTALIGPAFESYTMINPASVLVCSDTAVARFASQGWGRVIA